MAIVVILVSIFPLPLGIIKKWISTEDVPEIPPPRLVPCNDLKVTEVWSASFPYLTSEAEVRILDVNGDDVDDVLLGFGTGKS